MTMHYAKVIGGAALLAGATYGLHKLVEFAKDADDRRDTKLVSARGGSAAERMERAERASWLDNAGHAAVLVHAFDRSGDGRVASDEWVLRAGDDALYGNRLFQAARYVSPGAPEAVGPAEVETLLDLYSGPGDHSLDDFGSKLMKKGVGLQEPYPAFRSTERPLFESHDESFWERPIEVAGAQVMGRYDANVDGRVDVEREAEYRAGDFSSDATAFLQAADSNADGSVTGTEAIRQMRALDTHHADYWGIDSWDSKAGSNGVIDAGDYTTGRLDGL